MFAQGIQQMAFCIFSSLLCTDDSLLTAESLGSSRYEEQEALADPHSKAAWHATYAANCNADVAGSTCPVGPDD